MVLESLCVLRCRGCRLFAANQEEIKQGKIEHIGRILTAPGSGHCRVRHRATDPLFVLLMPPNLRKGKKWADHRRIGAGVRIRETVPTVAAWLAKWLAGKPDLAQKCFVPGLLETAARAGIASRHSGEW